MTNYPAGDFLIRIKNAALARQKLVLVSQTKLIKALAEGLKRLGVVDKVSQKDSQLEVSLTFKDKQPLVSDIKLVSRPGLRVYKGAEYFKNFKGPSVFLLSTPEGILSSKEAIKKNLGGEVIVEIL